MENVVGMDAAVTSLTTNLSAAAVWGVFTQAVPFIAVATLIAIGAYIIFRTLKKMRKMKN